MPARSKKHLPIPRDAKLFCPDCQSLQTIEFTDRTQEIDACLLICGHSRSAFVPPLGISLEHASSPEGIALFQANPRLAYQPAGKMNKRGKA